MSAFGATLLVLSVLAVVAVTAEIAASVRHRWRLALVVSRIVVLAAPAALLASLAWVVARAGKSPTEEKARFLAMGISEIMNCGVLLFLATLVSAVIWGVAHWRLRAAKKPVG